MLVRALRGILSSIATALVPSPAVRGITGLETPGLLVRQDPDSGSDVDLVHIATP